MNDILNRLYQTRMILISLIMVAAGAGLIGIGKLVAEHASGGFVALVPWAELGGVLVGAALLSVWLDLAFRREQQAIDDLRLRQLLDEQAPAMRDAVLEAFAANHEDLARVATPEMLDQIITNSPPGIYASTSTTATAVLPTSASSTSYLPSDRPGSNGHQRRCLKALSESISTAGSSPAPASRSSGHSTLRPSP